MEPERTYSATDVSRLVEILRASGDLSHDELAGMKKLLDVLRHLENMSDAGIENAVRLYFRST